MTNGEDRAKKVQRGRDRGGRRADGVDQVCELYERMVCTGKKKSQNNDSGGSGERRKNSDILSVPQTVKVDRRQQRRISRKSVPTERILTVLRTVRMGMGENAKREREAAPRTPVNAYFFFFVFDAGMLSVPLLLRLNGSEVVGGGTSTGETGVVATTDDSEEGKRLEADFFRGGTLIIILPCTVDVEGTGVGGGVGADVMEGGACFCFFDVEGPGAGGRVASDVTEGGACFCFFDVEGPVAGGRFASDVTEGGVCFCFFDVEGPGAGGHFGSEVTEGYACFFDVFAGRDRLETFAPEEPLFPLRFRLPPSLSSSSTSPSLAADHIGASSGSSEGTGMGTDDGLDAPAGGDCLGSPGFHLGAINGRGNSTGMMSAPLRNVFFAVVNLSMWHHPSHPLQEIRTRFFMALWTIGRPHWMGQTTVFPWG